jgi:glycosyltransferase involved in cell wall biosynthesis
MKENVVKYSIFTPIYNEEGNIIPLYEEVKKVMDKLQGSWELLLINDGSTDNSLNEILSIKDKRVRPIALQKNYGQSVAMDCGFKYVKGEFVITLDADLQNDPKDIPKLLDMLEKDHYDVVCGWRYKRKDPLWMLVITSAAKFLRKFFISDSIHDSGCTLRVYRRKIIKDLELWGEMHRYIVALLRWKGARIGEVKVNHRPRVNGYTKYNWMKSFKGFVDLFYVWFWRKFSSRPLHFLGIGGFVIMGLGFLSALWTAFSKIFLGVDLSDSVWFVLSFFLIIMGFHFFISGILLDVLIKDYYNNSYEKRYKIREIVTKRKR